MTMLGRGKKKAAKENAQETEEAVEALETEEAAEVAEAPEDDAPEDDAQAKLIQAKSELAKAEAELAKARLAEAEAELARAEKAARAREKAKAKGKVYDVTTDEERPAREARAPRKAREPLAEGRLTAIVGALGTVCALLAATAIFFQVQKSDQDARETAGHEALTAAAAAAQDFSSYDYRSLDSSFKTAMNEATGEWLRQYRQLTDQIRPTAAQAQVVVVGTVLKTGLEQVSSDRVVAVVFLNQQTAKAGQDKGYDQYRLRLTLEKHGGRWLVSNLQAL